MPKQGNRNDFLVKTRNFILKKQNHRCKDCGIRYPHLKFHHIDGYSSNNDISNCMALCPTCHDVRDRKLRMEKTKPIILPLIAPIILPKPMRTKNPPPKIDYQEAVRLLKELDFLFSV